VVEVEVRLTAACKNRAEIKTALILNRL
jgi:hypothetical protein